MRLALFSDPHGNWPALQAVLRSIDRRGADLTVCLGDLVDYAPWHREVIAELRRREISCLQGNHDQVQAGLGSTGDWEYPDPEERRVVEAAAAWTAERITPAEKEFLAGLPGELLLELAGRRCLFVHGTPGDPNHYLRAEAPEEELRAALAAGPADILFCGHTHRPARRLLAGGQVINPGSVGSPRDGLPVARWALVELARDVRVEWIAVPYDYHAAGRAILAAGLPPELAQVFRWRKPAPEGRG